MMSSRSERKRSKHLARRDAKIAQIRAELAQGQVGMALGRARGLATTFPFSVEVRDISGEACHQAGELMSAGLHWSLSGREDAIAGECIRRFEAAHPTARSAFDAYQFREMPFGRFESPRVNEALERMRDRLVHEGYSFRHLMARPGHGSGGAGGTIGGLVILAGVLAVLGILGAGIWQVGAWIFG
jgi:hypothetical protein